MNIPACQSTIGICVAVVTLSVSCGPKKRCDRECPEGLGCGCLNDDCTRTHCTCLPETCKGCCDEECVMLGGWNPARCGAFGRKCEDCRFPEVYCPTTPDPDPRKTRSCWPSQPTPVPAVCGCATVGVCYPGTKDNACGNNGYWCTTCEVGTHCTDAGECVDGGRG